MQLLQKCLVTCATSRRHFWDFIEKVSERQFALPLPAHPLPLPGKTNQTAPSTYGNGNPLDPRNLNKNNRLLGVESTRMINIDIQCLLVSLQVIDHPTRCPALPTRCETFPRLLQWLVVHQNPMSLCSLSTSGLTGSGQGLISQSGGSRPLLKNTEYSKN